MLEILNDLLWGPGTLTLLLGTGLLLSIRMRFLPWRRLSLALGSALGWEARQAGADGISPFSALMTTLAATIGTGNIVGVATALVAGGPGALVWMELSALLGMATTFAESYLAVKYRRRCRGGWAGGPMYVMEAVFGPRFGGVLGTLYALFAVGAALGIGGMTQANAITEALSASFSLPALPVGLVTAALALVAISGGIRTVSRVTSCLVPAMSAFYLAAGAAVLFVHRGQLLPGICEIFQSAFSLRAAAGGAIGAFTAARWGIARGVFSNEAGLGSAGIAAAAPDNATPLRQGLISMTGVFFDTVVLCTVTGLVICCSGVLGSVDAAGTPIDGGALTLMAFETVLGEQGAAFLAVSIVLFAFSTILGWAYQGETAVGFLTGGRFRGLFRLLYALAVLWGAGAKLESVYLFSDLCNALMCLPNLLCLLAAGGEAVAAMRAFSPPKGRKKV